MSETIGTPAGTAAEIVEIKETDAGDATDVRTADARTTDTRGKDAEHPAVHRAYSFACLNCGFGWEQDYELEQRADREGRVTLYYSANGVPVPSPLIQPKCPGCGGNHVRIFRAGRVADAANAWHTATHLHDRAPETRPEEPLSEPLPKLPELPEPEPVHGPVSAHRARRLHLPFHFHLRRRHSRPEA
jgi:hypothetical protein